MANSIPQQISNPPTSASSVSNNSLLVRTSAQQLPAAINSTAVAQKTSVMNSSVSINSLNNKATPVQNTLNHNLNTTSIQNSLPQHRPIDLNLGSQPPSASNSQYHNSSPSSVISPHSAPKLSKKGVKRKADTTTIEPPNLSNEPFNSTNIPSDDGIKPTKMSTRRESVRPIKKPSKELPDVDPQATGSKSKKAKMSERMKYCSTILKELLAKKHSTYAWPFYKPVDVKLYKLDDYYEIIKKPMDLGTAKSKMDRREYRKPQEFAEDIRLIFTNCYKYNPPDHEIVQMARKLQVIYMFF